MYQVSISRPPHPAIIELRADSAAVAACENALQCNLPNNDRIVLGADAITMCRVGPDAWLILAAPQQEFALTQLLESVVTTHHVAFSVITDALVSFRITGIDSRQILSQAVAIDLDPSVFMPGSIKRCAFAKSTAIVLCHDQDNNNNHNDILNYVVYDVLIESPHEQYAIKWFATHADQSVAESRPA
jgi:heterotetrameric sarcosine oxidase gamma subunit